MAVSSRRAARHPMIGFLAALCMVPVALGAEILGADEGFFLDLPETYELVSDDGKGKYGFQGLGGAVTFQVAVYTGGTYISADAIAQDVRRRLKGEVQGKRLRFQGRDAFYASLSVKPYGQALAGYGFFINGSGSERDYVVLSLADAADKDDYTDALLSALDSFSIDRGGLKLPGPVSWSEVPYDGGAETRASFAYAGATVEAPIRTNWVEASRRLAEREYRLLLAYQDSADYGVGAWKRFYRMIFRDSYSRLDSLAFALGIRVAELWDAGRLPGVGGRLLGPSAPAASSAGARSPEEEAALAEAVMALVQGFTYVRDTKGMDFTVPLEALLRSEGDCDARSMLAAILLQHWNLESGMMVSAEYFHAMALVDLEGAPGMKAGLSVDGKRFLAAETTDQVLPGLIASDMSREDAWIGIRFQF